MITEVQFDIKLHNKTLFNDAFLAKNRDKQQNLSQALHCYLIIPQ